jgi:hypothetical protein
MQTGSRHRQDDKLCYMSYYLFLVIRQVLATTKSTYNERWLGFLSRPPSERLLLNQTKMRCWIWWWLLVGTQWRRPLPWTWSCLFVRQVKIKSFGFWSWTIFLYSTITRKTLTFNWLMVQPVLVSRASLCCIHSRLRALAASGARSLTSVH